MSLNKKTTGKAIRPIFIPDRDSPGVKIKEIEFEWHLGMSPAVKKRSVQSLHESAKGYANILEASSKSENNIGIKLSAFFLKNNKECPVENLFQSSKKFEQGGPYKDLLTVSPRDAKMDSRLRSSGNLVSFVWKDKIFPLEPKSLFYDWLYMKVLEEDHNIELKDELLSKKFDAFSDIEFNPKKSFSCQARTLALYVSLVENELIKEFIKSPEEAAKKYNLYENVYYGYLNKNKKNNLVDKSKDEEFQEKNNKTDKNGEQIELF